MEFFPTTHWSLVLNAARGDPAQVQKALTQLCTTYWYPVYALSRVLGDSHEDAEDFTQAFFLHLIQSRMVDRVDPRYGKFRSFVQAAFRNFRAAQLRRSRAAKRGGGMAFIPLEELSPEDRYAQEPAGMLSPELRFDRNWALTVLDQAYTNLRQDYQQAGQDTLFARLAGFLPGRESSQEYETIAALLGKSLAAVKMDVSRLRKRFMETLLSIVRQTLADPKEAQTELRYLFEVLARPEEGL
jgi:RNA polymerase sigma-70 factor (ECF subfamily)